MKTLYQYTIKTDGQKTVLLDKEGNKRNGLPIATSFGNAEMNPLVSAGLLRDLAKWAIEQAEIIEELETDAPIPAREPFGLYLAQIVPVTG